MSPDAEAWRPNYTTFHSSASNCNNSAWQWSPSVKWCRHFSLYWPRVFINSGLEWSPALFSFKVFASHVLFLSSCCSVLFFATVAGAISPPPPLPWLACDTSGCSVYWTNASLEHFPHSLCQTFYVFGLEQPFGWCDEEPLKNHVAAPSSHILRNFAYHRHCY